MDTWYSKQLDSHQELVHSFSEFARGRDLAPLFAVYQRKDPDTGNVTFYFTPEAGKFAEQVGAEPCEKPHVDDGKLEYWGGDQFALTFYYPGAKGL